jgi:hypothetical protein
LITSNALSIHTVQLNLVKPVPVHSLIAISATAHVHDHELDASHEMERVQLKKSKILKV